MVVADLGVAKVYHAAMSTSGHDPRGTPLYMDPAPVIDDDARFGPVSLCFSCEDTQLSACDLPLTLLATLDAAGL